MTTEEMTAEQLSGVAGPSKVRWDYHPELPIEDVPVFVWPPRPLAALKYLVSRAYLLSVVLPFGLLAAITWAYLQPALTRCVDFEIGWIAQMYIRNLGLFALFVGGLHLYLYTFKLQGRALKFNPSELRRDDQRFFAQN